MKTSNKLIVVAASLLLAAGCARENRRASYDQSAIAGYNPVTGETLFSGRESIAGGTVSDPNSGSTEPKANASSEKPAGELSVQSNPDAEAKLGLPDSAKSVTSPPTELSPTSSKANDATRIYSNSSNSSSGPASAGRNDVDTSNPLNASSAIVTPPVTAESPANPEEDKTAKEQSKTGDQENSTNPSIAAGKSLTPTSARTEDRIYASNTSSSVGDKSTDATTLGANVQGTTDSDRTLAQTIVSNLKTEKAAGAEVTGIKIMVDSGKVTLRGKVKTEEQKKSIESAVQKVSGVNNVDNQLEVSDSAATSIPSSQ